MRIVLFNRAVVGCAPVPGEEWEHLAAYTDQSGSLLAFAPKTLVDYDIFVVDNELTQPRPEGPSELRSVNGEIAERVAGGGCLIIFAGPTRLRWLPQELRPRGSAGTRISIEDEDNPVSRFLVKRSESITYTTQFAHSVEWTTTARAMNRFSISAFLWHGHGVIVVLPEFKNRSAALRDFLDSVVPELLPDLRQDEPKSMEEAPPDWLHQFPVAGNRELESEITKTQEQITALRTSLEDLGERRRELAELQGLLWYEGRPLEIVVEKTLNLLGIDAAPRQPIDLVCTLDDGAELYIEIEGTVGPIQLRKGQQLLSYISGADDPAIVLGAIIGNSFRKESPKNRPPANSQAGLFSDPLKRLADQQKWKLVDTVKVFGWLKEHLAGKKEQASERARKALGIE